MMHNLNRQFRGVLMAQTILEILVLLREVRDPRPPVRLAEEGAAIRDRGVRRIVNPADLGALEEALILADTHGARVTVASVGPDRLDDVLRLALSMGATRAIRVWDPGFQGADAVAEARVLARIVEIVGPDLFFSGNRLLDRGSDPSSALAAATLGIPYVTSAVALKMHDGALEVLRKGDKGARLRIAAPLPCAIFFEDGTRDPRYPDHQALLRSLAAPVESCGLPELGLPFWEVGGAGALLPAAEYAFPRPNPLRAVTPDATLPAFERILALLSGGISAREGKMHSGSAEEIAEGLFNLLRSEGLVPERQG
jgi:electron transfer flavoprotein beta subunit